MEKKTTKWGRIVSIGLLGASLLASLSIPSAMAKSANAANAKGQTVTGQNAGMQVKAENRGGKMPLLNLENVTITVQYLDNGIKETFVAQDNSIIAQMKQFVARLNKADAARDEKKGDNAKINVVAEATATGMVITTTSSDAQVAARIIGESRIRGLERKLREAGVDIRAAITRSVQETEKGVIVNITSDNADVARLIKLREKYPMEGPGPRGMQPGNRPNLPPGQRMKNKLGNQELPAQGAEDTDQDATLQDSTL